MTPPATLPVKRSWLHVLLASFVLITATAGDCEDDPAGPPQTLPGDITVTIAADGAPFTGDVQVALTGTASRTQTVTGGSFTFADLPPGSYTVTITAPAAHACATNSATVTLASNGTQTVAFDCTRTVPTGAEIAATSFDFRSTVTSTTCPGVIDVGDQLDEDDFSADFDAATGILTLNFEGGGFVAGPFTPETGVFDAEGDVTFPDGTTFRGELDGTFSIENGAITFTGTDVNMLWVPGSDPDTDPPDCTFERDVTILVHA